MYYNNKEFDKLVSQMLDKCEKRDTKRIWSYELAKILGKVHKAVMRDIREELEREIDFDLTDCFWFDTYLDSYGRLQPAYTINAEGVLYLAGRYSRYNYKIRKDMVKEHKRLNFVLKKE